MITRRFLLVAGAAALAPVSAGAGASDGRLRARPIAGAAVPPAGRYYGPAGSVMLVPEGLTGPAPLLVSLHGRTANAAEALGAFDRLARSRRFILLAPKSDGITWDHAPGVEAADVAAIDAALAWAFEKVAVDTRRVGLAGFSDGASMALSMGLTNGDLFTHVFAFAPGRYHAETTQGRPRLFFSHGRDDRVLPYSVARSMARDLERDGYPVMPFHAFKGGHQVSQEGARKAVEALLG